MNPTPSLINAPLYGKGSKSAPTFINYLHEIGPGETLQEWAEAVCREHNLDMAEAQMRYLKQPSLSYSSLYSVLEQMIDVKQNPPEKQTPPSQMQTPLEPRKLFRSYVDESGAHVPDEYILEIDNSSLEYFNACPRAAEYQLIKARGFSGSAATRYGSAIHKYLEMRLRGGEVGHAQQLMLSMFHSFPPLQPDEWRTVDHAMNAMEQYENFYRQQDRLKVAYTDNRDTPEPYVEVPFRLPLTVIDINDDIPFAPHEIIYDYQDTGETAFHVKRVHVYWTGKIDLLCLYDEKPAVLDHKTSSMLGALFYKEFELASQTVGYVWASRRLGDPLFLTNSRFVLDVIVGRKPTPTGIAHEFERHVYTYTDEQITEWQVNTQHIIADFLSHLLRGYFPMQTRWCVNKYGLCPFHDVCVMPSEFRLQHLNAAFQPVTWSPLL
jgi:hypothetical protein